MVCERRLKGLNLVMPMGSIAFTLAARRSWWPRGIAEAREKHVLGVWQGATENTTVVKGRLEDLVDRELDRGSKALRARVKRVFGEQAEVHRSQIHKRRNVKEYLPENSQKDYDRRMHNAYAMCWVRPEPQSKRLSSVSRCICSVIRLPMALRLVVYCWF